VFAALGIAPASGRLAEGGLLVLGVFLGSALWWFLLFAGAGVFRNVMESVYLRWIHHVSGALLVAFGVGVLATVVI
jgi:threonine/homoserine/homoserine lactone efflux protein